MLSERGGLVAALVLTRDGHAQADAVGVADAVQRQRDDVLAPEDVARLARARHARDLAPAAAKTDRGHLVHLVAANEPWLGPLAGRVLLLVVVVLSTRGTARA